MISLQLITATGTSSFSQRINPSMVNVVSARLLKVVLPIGVLGGIELLTVRSTELTAKALTPAYETGFIGDILGVQSVDPVTGTASWVSNPTLFFTRPTNLNGIDITVTTPDGVAVVMGAGDTMTVVLELGQSIPRPVYN